MRWCDTAFLVQETYPSGDGTNDNGFPVKPDETLRKVYVNKRSVSGNEFLNAYRSGISADMLFDIRACDYKGERYIEHAGKRYRIYKTFVKGSGDVTELKCTDMSERGKPVDG